MITEADISNLTESISPDIQLLFLEFNTILDEVDGIDKHYCIGDMKLGEDETPEDRLMDLLFRVDQIRSYVNAIKKRHGNVETALKSIEEKIDSTFGKLGQTPHKEARE